MTPPPSLHDPEFAPRLRQDVVWRSFGQEAVAWSPERREPAYLDPFAVLLSSVMDGEATLAELADDIAAEFDLAAEAAVATTRAVTGYLDLHGLLTTSEPEDVPWFLAHPFWVQHDN
jgi:hypothetical protein